MNTTGDGYLSRIGININRLEDELDAAVARDTRYWLENDAKIRAVEQRVPTYEHFRQMVAGCHLRPLDKAEMNDLAKSKTNWNPTRTISGRLHSSGQGHVSERCVTFSAQTPQQFYARWQSLNSVKNETDKEKTSKLARLVFEQQPEILRGLFDCGLGIALLPDLLLIFEDILSNKLMNELVEEQLADKILDVLLAFSNSKQFPLAVDLCSDLEKQKGLSMLHHLSTSLPRMRFCDLDPLKSYFSPPSQ